MGSLTTDIILIFIVFRKNTRLRHSILINFNNSLFQGRGILYENGLKIYEGDFENNLYWGNGISFYENSENIEYEGEWVNGCKHGQGTLYSDSGEIVYSGLFHNNEIQMN